MDFKERRILGRTGLQVSRLGLAGGYGVPAHTVEKAYHEYGINYFYWSTPRKKGMRNGLRNLVKKNRSDLVIVLQSYDHLGLMLNRSIRGGLKNLNTDYADVALLGYYNHYPSERVINEALELKEKGLIRHIALSGHNRKLFGEIAGMKDNPIDIFMVRYNAAHRGAEGDIFPFLPKEDSPGLTIYTATRWGQLMKASKMPPDSVPLTVSEAYRFVLSNPQVDLCMMGPGTEHEFNEGVRALDEGPLTEEEMNRVRKIGDYLHGK